MPSGNTEDRALSAFSRSAATPLVREGKGAKNSKRLGGGHRHNYVILSLAEEGLKQRTSARFLIASRRDKKDELGLGNIPVCFIAAPSFFSHSIVSIAWLSSTLCRIEYSPPPVKELLSPFPVFPRMLAAKVLLLLYVCTYSTYQIDPDRSTLDIPTPPFSRPFLYINNYM